MQSLQNGRRFLILLKIKNQDKSLSLLSAKSLMLAMQSHCIMGIMGGNFGTVL